MTVVLTFEDMDREDVRLVYAALRDKHQQIVARAARDGDPEGVAGLQAHRLAGLADQVKRVYDKAPMPKVSGEYRA